MSMDSYYKNKIIELGLVSSVITDEHEVELSSQNLNFESFQNSGIPIRITEDNRVYFPKQLSNGICIGSSGSGKTSCCSINYTIMNLKAGNNIIIVDTKNSNYMVTSQLAKELNYDIKVFNLYDKSHSNHWNPLFLPFKLINSKNDNDQERGYELINEFCEMLKEKQVVDVFWENSSTDTIAGIIHILFKLLEKNDIPTINQVINIINTGKKQCGSSNYLKELLELKFKDDLVIQSLLSSYISAPRDTKASIDSVLSEKMNRFSRSEQILNILASDDLEIEKISGQDKKIIYINLPDYSELYHQIASLLVRQIIVQLERDAELRHNGSLPKKVSFVLEEFAQYKISDFASVFSTSRSRNIEFLLIIQSFSQLYDSYGQQQARTIIDNAMVFIYMYDKDFETINYISQLSGSNQIYSHGQKIAIPRISVNDLLTLPPFKAVIVLNRKKAFYTDLKPYYKCMSKLNESYVPFPNSRKILVKKRFDVKSIVDNIRKEIFQQGDDLPSYNVNVNNLLKRIDKKIVELEKESEEEKSDLFEINDTDDHIS